jgi:hypothetical protein
MKIKADTPKRFSSILAESVKLATIVLWPILMVAWVNMLWRAFI